MKNANETNVLPYALYAGPAGSSGTADHAFVPLLWAYGGELQDQSGKWIGDSPATRKVMAYYQKAYDGLSPKEILTATKPWTAMREKLGNGQLALLFEGGWVYGGWASADKAGDREERRLRPPSDRERRPVVHDRRPGHLLVHQRRRARTSRSRGSSSRR